MLDSELDCLLLFCRLQMELLYRFHFMLPVPLCQETAGGVEPPISGLQPDALPFGHAVKLLLLFHLSYAALVQ